MRLFVIAALAAMIPLVSAQAQPQKFTHKAPPKAHVAKQHAGRANTRKERCKRAYKSYDVRTGRYRDSKRVSRPCTL